VPILVHGITRGLFAEDIDEHWASLSTYDVRQAEVRDVKPMQARSAAE
jgi:hypothetical protein